MRDRQTRVQRQLNQANRVLVLVRGGVAEVFADASVQVFLLDYDNEPDKSIPDGYVHLLTSPR
jgi:hypothetical protein